MMWARKESVQRKQMMETVECVQSSSTVHCLYLCVHVCVQSERESERESMERSVDHAA